MSGIGSPLRTQGNRAEVMALVAWISGSAALGSSLYSSRIAALFAFLVGVVVVVTLRVTVTFGLAAAAFGAVLFTIAHLALDTGVIVPRLAHLELQGMLTQALLRQESVWVGMIVAVVVLMVSSLLADVVSRGAACHPEEEESAPALEANPQPVLPPRLDRREAGLLKAEWELTRAITYRHHLTLGLVGPDADQGAEEQSRPSMDALDHLLCDTFTAFDVICAYGPWERLIVMPEEPSERVAAGAMHLCEVASDRLGCPVRMSVAGFPEDGSTLSELLSRLDQRLLYCRQTHATVCADQAFPPSKAIELPEPSTSSSRDVTPNGPLPPTERPRLAERSPGTGSRPTSEVEVLDPLELPSEAVEPMRRDEIAEKLQTVLGDPWSALEAADEGPDGQPPTARPMAMTRAREAPEPRSRPEPSTGTVS
jgi:hypothetical protein